MIKRISFENSDKSKSIEVIWETKNKDDKFPNKHILYKIKVVEKDNSVVLILDRINPKITGIARPNNNFKLGEMWFIKYINYPDTQTISIKNEETTKLYTVRNNDQFEGILIGKEGDEIILDFTTTYQCTPNGWKNISDKSFDIFTENLGKAQELN